MGRLNGPQEKRARAGERSLVAQRAREDLARRGVAVRLEDLGRRSLAECIDAVCWANNVRPITVRPPWLAELLASGRATLLPDVCLSCGRTGEDDPELVWATVDRTICVDCFDPVHVARPTLGDRLRAERAKAGR